jgi:septum formation protein
MKLILASQSAGRAALLKGAGYRFRQVPSRVEEPEPMEGTHLERYVLELAVLKAKAVAERFPEAMVIGADTALILGRQVIGKPDTLADARRMLTELGGRSHRISSAACVIFPTPPNGGKRRIVRLVDTAHVVLRKWTPERIKTHVALTRPLSWAGAYAVQDPYSAAIVERIEGDLATVIGLPMVKLEEVFSVQKEELIVQKNEGMKRCRSMPPI